MIPSGSPLSSRGRQDTDSSHLSPMLPHPLRVGLHSPHPSRTCWSPIFSFWPLPSCWPIPNPNFFSTYLRVKPLSLFSNCFISSLFTKQDALIEKPCLAFLTGSAPCLTLSKEAFFWLREAVWWGSMNGEVWSASHRIYGQEQAREDTLQFHPCWRWSGRKYLNLWKLILIGLSQLRNQNHPWYMWHKL